MLALVLFIFVLFNEKAGLMLAVVIFILVSIKTKAGLMLALVMFIFVSIQNCNTWPEQDGDSPEQQPPCSRTAGTPQQRFQSLRPSSASLPAWPAQRRQQPWHRSWLLWPCSAPPLTPCPPMQQAQLVAVPGRDFCAWFDSSAVCSCTRSPVICLCSWLLWPCSAPSLTPCPPMLRAQQVVVQNQDFCTWFN